MAGAFRALVEAAGHNAAVGDAFKNVSFVVNLDDVALANLDRVAVCPCLTFRAVALRCVHDTRGAAVWVGAGDAVADTHSQCLTIWPCTGFPFLSCQHFIVLP